ncbi:MAG: hypothetical protein GY711_04720 [bacterium]|nr:hypothetical protein [bacterium]
MDVDLTRIAADVSSSNLQARAEQIGRADKSAEADMAEAGEEMEALFTTMLIKEMRKSLPNEGFFGDGVGADTFNGWMDEFLGRELAKNGALEMAGLVKAALRRGEATE